MLEGAVRHGSDLGVERGGGGRIGRQQLVPDESSQDFGVAHGESSSCLRAAASTVGERRDILPFSAVRCPCQLRWLRRRARTLAPDQIQPAGDDDAAAQQHPRRRQHVPHDPVDGDSPQAAPCTRRAPPPRAARSGMLRSAGTARRRRARPRAMSHFQCARSIGTQPGAARQAASSVIRPMVQKTTLSGRVGARQHPHRDGAQRVGAGGDERGERPEARQPRTLGRSMMNTPASPTRMASQLRQSAALLQQRHRERRHDERRRQEHGVGIGERQHPHRVDERHRARTTAARRAAGASPAARAQVAQPPGDQQRQQR